jgi:uncharacterized protein with gpF-like domain
VFDSSVDYRSAMIARTEVISASNQGLILAARQGSVVTTKTWLSASDERTRDDHLDADGQTVPIDQPFDVGGEEMDAPGDPSASEENVINCRCIMWFGADPADDLDAPDLPTEDG